MAGYFDGVFTRVGVGSTKHGHQHFINDGGAISDVGVEDGVRCYRVAAQGTEGADNGKGLRT